MKDKSKYIRPEVETINIEMENIIAVSVQVQEEEVTGTTRARRFWDDEI